MYSFSDSTCLLCYVIPCSSSPKPLTRVFHLISGHIIYHEMALPNPSFCTKLSPSDIASLVEDLVLHGVDGPSHRATLPSRPPTFPRRFAPSFPGIEQPDQMFVSFQILHARIKSEAQGYKTMWHFPKQDLVAKNSRHTSSSKVIESLTRNRIWSLHPHNRGSMAKTKLPRRSIWHMCSPTGSILGRVYSVWR
jgi:hypothetical protein